MDTLARNSEMLAQELAADPDYRVLRRFYPRASYGARVPGQAVRRGVFVDVETTGVDVERCELIELAIQPFTYDPESGQVVDVPRGASWLQEPSGPIPDEVVSLTGITPEMVRGRALDVSAVHAELAGTSLVVAHNATFDRQVCERYLEVFVRLPWACAHREIDWRPFGVHGGALQNVLMSACGEFTADGHRALVDCQIGVHVLAAAAHPETQRTALSLLLESARAPLWRVRALGSPRYAKDALRARGYRARYEGGDFQYWYRDLRDSTAIDAELDWCADCADAEPDVITIDPRDRYSRRAL